MQADQNNYQPDKQFTDQGWNEMLKTLDQEMPVQERKRRGFLWFFPFLLIGVVASIWAFYPKTENAEIAQSQEVIFDKTKTQTKTQTQTQDSKTTSENNVTILNENTSIINQNIKPNNSQIGNKTIIPQDDFPSIIKSSNPLLPPAIEEIESDEKTEIKEVKEPIAKLEKEVRTINPSFITLALIELQKEKELVIEEREFFFEEKNIVKTPKSTDREKEFGIFAGVVTDFSNVDKIGFTSGGFIHFPIRKKLGLKTGLGYSLLQKDLAYSFIGNQDALLSPEFIEQTTIISSPPPFSTVAVQTNADFILEKFHQLDIPVLLTYSPIKKIQFQIGINASFLLKEKIRLINNSIKINQSVNDDYSNYGIELDALDLNSISEDQYAEENYWNKLNLSGVVGFAWKPTRRINLELQYHHGFFPILKTNSSRDSILNPAGATFDNNYQVHNNPAYPNSNFSAAESRSIKRIFNKNRFIKNNHSLRFTLGFTF